MSFVFHARRGVLRKALQLGQSLPRAHCYMVLEDDVWADDAVLVREIMTEAQHAMVKDWIVLQLGSRNCGRAPHSLRRTVKELSDGFKLCVAERNILAHAYVVNKNTVIFCCITVAWAKLLTTCSKQYRMLA